MSKVNYNLSDIFNSIKKASTPKTMISVLVLSLSLFSLFVLLGLIRQNQAVQNWAANLMNFQKIPLQQPITPPSPTLPVGWRGLFCSPKWSISKSSMEPSISIIYQCEITNDGSFYKGGESLEIINIVYRCASLSYINPGLCKKSPDTDYIFRERRTIVVPSPSRTEIVRFKIPDQPCRYFLQGLTAPFIDPREEVPLHLIGESKLNPATIKTCREPEG